MAITNAEIRAQATKTELPNTAFALSGQAKDIALVLAEVVTAGVGVPISKICRPSYA